MIKNLTTKIVTLTSLITLTACTTINPNTGAQEANRTGTGALVGAAAGAVAGGLIGDSKKAAIIGAGVGALGGAAVGSYMDKQEQALRDDLEGTGVEIERVGDNIKLNMPSSITFDTNQAVIKPEFFPVLNQIGNTLSEFQSTIVVIAGHTDSTGSAEYNQQLSMNRANSVSYYLMNNGVINERIATTGYGESLPIADNGTPDGRQINRRVEITLQPLTES
jgi:outer membrane protein OmpA-like peptidoglycan-associated protein